MTDSALMQAFFDGTDAGCYIKDAEGRFLFVNRKGAEWLGRSSTAECIGMTAYDFVPKDEADATSRQDRAVAMAGAPLTFDSVVDLPSAKRRLLDHKFPVSIPDHPGALGGIAVEVPEPRSALGQHGLSDSEVRTIEQTVEAWTKALADHDLDEWVTYWAKDGVLIPPGHPPVVGHAQLVAYIAADFGGISDFAFSDWRVVGREDLAVATNDISWPAVGAGARIDARQTLVLRRNDDGRWLVHNVIFNMGDKG